MKELLYLSLDSLQEGVGASQVLAYMKKVQGYMHVTVISFEKAMPSNLEVERIQSSGITWIPLSFGRFGALGGVGRVFRMWLRVDRSKIIHARSTLPALAAMLRFPKKWIWDCRSLQADQRRALSRSNQINLSFLVMRCIEYIIAKRTTSIIVITKAVIPIMLKRYRIMQGKIHVIPTCVDIERFQPGPMNKTTSLRILFAGTFSPAYDIKLINRIIKELRKVCQVEVTVATSLGTTQLWKELDYDAVTSASHSDMPSLILAHDIGISVWKNDLGVCLSAVASTKTAEFLACGKPIIINSNQGDYGKLVSDFRAGVVTFGSSDLEVGNYAKKIIELLNDKETLERCRNLALTHFNLDYGIEELIKIYRET